jgi:hypothetical protein
MTAYRCFAFDDRKRIIGSAMTDLLDDRAARVWAADALAHGAGLVCGGAIAAVEVWQHDRRVCRLETAGDQERPTPAADLSRALIVNPRSKEWHHRAYTYRRLAERARSPEARRTYAEIAQTCELIGTRLGLLDAAQRDR